MGQVRIEQLYWIPGVSPLEGANRHAAETH